MSKIEQFKDIVSSPSRLKKFEMLKEHLEHKIHLNLDFLDLMPEEEEAFRIYINIGKFLNIESLIYIEEHLGPLKEVDDEYLKRINDLFIRVENSLYNMLYLAFLTMLTSVVFTGLAVLNVIKVSFSTTMAVHTINILVILLYAYIKIRKNWISFYIIKYDSVLKKVLSPEHPKP